MLATMLLVTIFGPLIAPYGAATTSPDSLAGPSAAHWLGTDSLGRDMLVDVEQIASMSLMGTIKLDLPAEQRKAAVSQVKAKVSRSAKFVGQNAIQTHGGIGITQELAIGHYFKRATMIEGQFGSADYHLDRYEQLTLAD